MHNVEIKLELREPAIARAALAKLGARADATLVQTDTYFRVPTGRLKRRETEGRPTEWIRYDRIDGARPRLSHFDVMDEARARALFGADDPPVRAVVRKTRELFMAERERVRVHVDAVERLGDFIEFEALVQPAFNAAACHAALRRLRSGLGPALGEVIAVSYGDMIERLDARLAERDA